MLIGGAIRVLPIGQAHQRTPAHVSDEECAVASIFASQWPVSDDTDCKMLWAATTASGSPEPGSGAGISATLSSPGSAACHVGTGEELACRWPGLGGRVQVARHRRPIGGSGLLKASAWVVLLTVHQRTLSAPAPSAHHSAHWTHLTTHEWISSLINAHLQGLLGRSSHRIIGVVCGKKLPKVEEYDHALEQAVAALDDRGHVDDDVGEAVNVRTEFDHLPYQAHDQAARRPQQANRVPCAHDQQASKVPSP